MSPALHACTHSVSAGMMNFISSGSQETTDCPPPSLPQSRLSAHLQHAFAWHQLMRGSAALAWVTLSGYASARFDISLGNAPQGDRKSDLPHNDRVPPGEDRRRPGEAREGAGWDCACSGNIGAGADAGRMLGEPRPTSRQREMPLARQIAA